MALIERHESGGVRCDATGCEAEERWPWVTFRALDHIREIGWSAWHHLRGTRYYCPDHGPRPGHKMRRIA